MSVESSEFTREDARAYIRVPTAGDDKYSHGVLGVATGSDRYPGAAVLGVDAAYATGVGMVRYLGPQHATDLVLGTRPEAVPGDGRVDAWLVGSGTDWTDPRDVDARSLRALTSGLPVVIDAGALPLVTLATGRAVLTPHARELERLAQGILPDLVPENSVATARAVADATGAVVVVKGHTTHVVGPISQAGRCERRTTAPTTWLATAGTGDVLAGIIAALLATHASDIEERPDILGPLAATGCLIHGLAAATAGRGGPLGASDIAPEIATVVAGIV